MHKKIIMAVLAMSIAGAVSAQKLYSLVGNVADSKGEVLPFTNCVLLRAADSSFAYGTTGDIDGRFSISNISGGDYLLRVTFLGYDPYLQRIEINRDIDLAPVVLDKNATMLKEVKITANRPLYSADAKRCSTMLATTPVCRAATLPMPSRTPPAWRLMPRAT